VAEGLSSHEEYEKVPPHVPPAAPDERSRRGVLTSRVTAAAPRPSRRRPQIVSNLSGPGCGGAEPFGAGVERPVRRPRPNQSTAGLLAARGADEAHPLRNGEEAAKVVEYHTTDEEPYAVNPATPLEGGVELFRLSRRRYQTPVQV